MAAGQVATATQLAEQALIPLPPQSDEKSTSSGNYARTRSIRNWLIKRYEADNNHVGPERAIQVYISLARTNIDLRSRDNYAVAARHLASARDTYRLSNNEAVWQTLISEIKTEFKRLPALQDELRKAGL